MTEEEDERVGYCSPPMATRWRKGCPSPNPRGRRRKRINNQFGDDVAEMLAEPIQARAGEQRISMSVATASFRQLTARAIKGDLKAIRFVLDSIEALALLLEADLIQEDRHHSSVKRFFELVIEDPEERERQLQDYYNQQGKRKKPRHSS